MAGDDTTAVVQGWIDRMGGGPARAPDRAALLACARGRLERLARRMLRGYPGVARWEQTDDVLQNALVRLDRALQGEALASPLHFFRLASLQIRRELIDLSRHYSGPEGLGAHHSSVAGIGEAGSADGAAGLEPSQTTHDPQRLAAWTEFHRAIGGLDDEHREAWDLLWYQGPTQAEAAAALGLSESTVYRRWMAARLELARRLGGRLPE